MPESKPTQTSFSEPQKTSTWAEAFTVLCQKLRVEEPTLEEALENGPKFDVYSGEDRAGRTLVSFGVKDPTQRVTPEYEAEVKAEYRAEHPEMPEEHFEAAWQRDKHYLL